jgi:molybdenum cofactor cytidylyltransferase
MESNSKLSSITGVLLAAGQSNRFGSNKMLYPLASGEPMAVACARTLIGVLPECVAIVRPQDTELALLLGKQGFNIVENPRPQDGIGSSIACAVSSVADAAGWVFALADMPFIKPAVIKRVVSNLEQGATVSAPVYEGRRGHPVGFSHTMYNSLKALSGDEGAKRLIRNPSPGMILFQTDEKGVIEDIDSLQDLRERA